MPTCFIDNQPYKIKLADTPFVKNWLEIYDNKDFLLFGRFFLKKMFLYQSGIYRRIPQSMSFILRNTSRFLFLIFQILT